MTAHSTLEQGLRKALEAAWGVAPDPAHDIAHVERVVANARMIANGEGLPETPTLIAAAWLHDLVALPNDHPDRASASRLSEQAAEPILRGLGLGADRIAAARHAIEAHSFSAGIAPATPEARVLQDADRLDALGAVGLARCLAVGGALGRPLFDPADPFATHRPLDDGRWTVDHFAVKLLRLPGTMRTATARAIAETRAGVLRRFLSDLAADLGQPAPEW